MIDWSLRRARFNHDRLKNEFMQAVLRLIRILEGRVNDDCFVEQFFEELDGKWRMLRAEAHKLAQEAPGRNEMQCWFGEYPLCFLSEQDRAWMVKLLNQEFGLPDRGVLKVERVTRYLAEIDDAVETSITWYERRWRGRADSGPLAADSLLNLASRLYQCCSNLCDALSSLAPSNAIDVLAANDSQRTAPLQS